MHILNLPIEIQSHILGFLPWHDHFLVSTVCTLWKSILQRHGLRTKRHYDHPVPASWDAVEHPYPVFNSPTPRVSADLYTPMDAPNTHVLLERGMLMFEICEDGRTTVLMKLPRDVLISGTALADTYEVLRADSGTPETTQYSEFWEAMTPPDSGLLDITTSPLLESDTLVFSLRHSDAEEGVDTSTLDIPGIPNSTRTLSFTIWGWDRDESRFQFSQTVPSGHAIDDPEWSSKQWDWVRGSPRELVRVVKQHLKTHVWCNNGVVEKCFVQVEGFNIFGENLGETIRVTVATFPV
ncbi:hypothetical protein TWF718_008472 [Orbilia javanica]|uniref:F-box domain-containing protein n=1 Tax=Orbilia javanica TaxID=47235 RepID=A0AAN8MSN4_9PEZI